MVKLQTARFLMGVMIIIFRKVQKRFHCSVGIVEPLETRESGVRQVHNRFFAQLIELYFYGS